MSETKTTLIVMAAGMGSRFGGFKQMTPVSPGGEALLDFSVYDAAKAGFNKVVFIITKELERDFRETVGKRAERRVEVDYAFQDIKKVPAWFTVPSERTKPWGTAHAVLCAAERVDTPFAVINADDYYGQTGYAALHGHLITCPAHEYAMVGFKLENTLTDFGTVARGVCEIENGWLKNIVERTQIKGSKYTEDGENWIPLPENTVVSMNMWGFTPEFFGELEAGLDGFLKTSGTLPKAEYFLPFVVDNAIKNKIASARVLPSGDKWYGMTYKEDRPYVERAIREFIDGGMYVGL